MTAAARFRTLAYRFSEVLDAVPPDGWSSPSPCAGWTAADVVRHVVETERDLLGRMPFGDVTDLAEIGDPVAAWPVVRDRVQAALDDPAQARHEYEGFLGPTTFAATIESFYAFDLVVHAWDVARATGLSAFEAIDPADIVWAHDAMSPMGNNVRMDGIFGPEVTVAVNASPQDKFLAWTGRTP